MWIKIVDYVTAGISIGTALLYLWVALQLNRSMRTPDVEECDATGAQSQDKTSATKNNP